MSTEIDIPRSSDERDPHYHTARIAGMLNEIVRHVRDDTAKVDDPKAKALFETSAEVLTGLATAYRHFDEHTEVWR
jgi:hypothetical protein